MKRSPGRDPSPDAIFGLDICYKQPGFLTFCCSTLSPVPPLVISCARPETLRGPGSM